MKHLHGIVGILAVLLAPAIFAGLAVLPFGVSPWDALFVASGGVLVGASTLVYSGYWSPDGLAGEPYSGGP